MRAAVRQLHEAGVPVVGASDHGVTHSLYIDDPDGNEIELYIDVQPETWRDDPMAVFAPIKPLHRSSLPVSSGEPRAGQPEVTRMRLLANEPMPTWRPSISTVVVPSGDVAVIVP